MCSFDVTHTSQIFHDNGVNKPLSRELQMIARNRQKVYTTSLIQCLQTKTILKINTVVNILHNNNTINVIKEK